MAKRVASCLVENKKGEILFVKRRHGKEKGKWSLPGGLANKGESSKDAAFRRTRIETGLRIRIVSTVRVGEKYPIKTYAGRVVGGHLQYHPGELLDARFRRPYKVKSHELAFESDRRALKEWSEMKKLHGQAAGMPLPQNCPRCGGLSIRLRHEPHHNPYQCRSCKSTFRLSAGSTGIQKTALGTLVLSGPTAQQFGQSSTLPEKLTQAHIDSWAV